MTISHLTTSGKLEKKPTSSPLFSVPMNKVLLAQAIRVYQANLRQGTSSTKTRSDINRTKKKWYKQKGTGNARHGARTPSIFVGGGVAFGPHANQQWQLTLPKALRRQALLIALSAQVEHCVVADQVESLKGKTKAAAKLLAPVIQEKKKLLVILTDKTELAHKALRNLSTVLIRDARRLTALEVAMADRIVLTAETIKVLEERLLTQKTPKQPKSKMIEKKTVSAKTPVKTKSVTKKKPVAKAPKGTLPAKKSATKAK